MTAIIQIEKLTKSYGSHRGIIDIDLEVAEGEAFGFLGPNGAGKTTTIRTLLDHIRPTSGRARIFGIETTVDPVAIHRRLGYLPGEFALYDKLTGGQTIEYFANLRGGVDAGLPAAADPAPRPRPEPQVQGVLEGQQAEDRAGRRPPASAGPADPRRADVGARSARPADVLRAHPRGEGRGPDDLPARATSSARSRRPATASRSSATGRLVKVDRVEALRDLAHHQVELRFAGDRADRPRSTALPGVSDVVAEDHTLRMRVAGSITPVVREAAQLRARSTSSVASRRSKRRSSPSTAAGRSRQPDMTVEVGRRPAPMAPTITGPSLSRASTASAASSARRSATRAARSSLVGGVLGLLLIARQRRDRPASSTRRRRASSSSTVVAAVPPILAGPGRQGRSTSGRSAGTSSTSTARSSRSSSASGRSSRCRRRWPPRHAAAASSSSRRAPMTRRRDRAREALRAT